MTLKARSAFITPLSADKILSQLVIESHWGQEQQELHLEHREVRTGFAMEPGQHVVLELGVEEEEGLT